MCNFGSCTRELASYHCIDSSLQKPSILHKDLNIHIDLTSLPSSTTIQNLPLPITTENNNMSALKQNLAITTTPSHELHLRAVPTPTPGPNECLIHVRATGICGSDVHFWKEGGIGSSKVEGELGLGHESAGVVVGLGEGVENWRVGECFSFSFVLILVMMAVVVSVFEEELRSALCVLSKEDWKDLLIFIMEV